MTNVSHLQEQQSQMITQLRGVDGLLVAHFKPDSRERQESQRLLHQIWSLCFLGYNTQPVPKPETVTNDVHVPPMNAPMNEESARHESPTKLESMQ